ncbi:MAG TPA: MBL fold metallo-hydrolase, partial [Hanamia sp.]|nr:MBL fold metallo-hydrolase [Hanamia sp.]
SSSAGNCYLLENEKETLIIEAGLRFDDIKRGLKYNLRKGCGCLVSHEHGDHCKGAKDMLNAGITIFASEGTHKGINGFLKFDRHHRQVNVFPGQQFYAGNFRIIPFDVKHDAYQPTGFLINHEETGTILFVTDTYYVANTFRGLNNVIVEANFCQKILDGRMAAGESPDFLRNRIFKSHMSLATCKDLLRANDLSNVNNIVLIHLSDSNSDAKRFQQEITEVTGKVVTIAEPGLQINFSKNPF